MRKYVIISLLVSFSVYAENPTNKTNGYNDGINFGKGISPNLNDIKNYDTSKFIEGGISSNPEQTKYYNGVKGSNDGSLMSEGINAFGQSELKQSIYDSINNKPSLTTDHKLISDSLLMQDGVIKDDQGNFCMSTIQNEAIYNIKSCKQNLSEYGSCFVKANIGWRDDLRWEQVEQIISLNPISGTVNNTNFKFKPQITGNVIDAKITYKTNGYYGRVLHTWGDNGWNISRERLSAKESFTITFLNQIINGSFSSKTYTGETFNVTGNIEINKDVEELIKFQRNSFSVSNEYTGGGSSEAKQSNVYNEFLKTARTNYRELSIRLILQGYVLYKEPVISWDRSCDFDFDYNNDFNVNENNLSQVPSTFKIVQNECVLGESTKIVIDELGQAHTINLPCYEFEEIYKKPEKISESCEVLKNDPTCIQESSICELKNEQGQCVQYSINYSCETIKSTQGYQCGNLFYEDCETEDCDLSEENANFGDVISKLQTVKEAAQDINDDPNNIKIFTGKSLECRKTGFGYNDCCSDDGWGQSVGLAGCDNEEKELAAAKGKGLTISVGEYCSKDVLGVCLEKKRSYCTFNSKLAKIVQQQGRGNQLNIDFGKAKSPDCRGLSLIEFEQLNFDIMNFSEFYGELNQQIDIPTEQAIKDKIKGN